MIESFRDSSLEQFFSDDRRDRTVPADLTDRLFRKLQLLDDATSDADLRIPPGNRFERLGRKLSDFHSIRANQH